MKTEQKHIPIRTCVICRQKFAKQSLHRYVLKGLQQNSALEEKKCAQSIPVLDVQQLLVGRGIYLCKAEKCQERFAFFGKKGKGRKGGKDE